MSLEIWLTENRPQMVFDTNMTHNLNEMVAAAGEEYYQALWYPERLGLVRAEDVVPYIDGLEDELLRNPEKYKKLNPPNGWGTYEGLLRTLIEYRSACLEYPDAEVSVSR